MKIGVFGGTFEPIHIGPIVSVLEVKIAFGLDRVIFISAQQAPHKETKTTGNKKRTAMIQKAIAGYEGFIMDTVELDRAGKSFTYDTAKYLKDEYLDDEIYFLMGIYQYVSFDKWHKQEELIEMMNFNVMMRNTDDIEISKPFISL